MTARKSENKTAGAAIRKSRARQNGAGKRPVTTTAQTASPSPPAPEERRKDAAPVTVPHPGGHAEGAAAAGRAFWSGAISIGLVNIPVQLHTMVRDNAIQFRLLHKEDGQPLRYDRVCTRDNTVVPWAETVRGYEVRKGEFLVFTPGELKAVMPESDRKIRLTKFVYYLSLDPMYFGTSYLLLPDKSDEAYSLLHATIRDAGKAGVGTITLRTKEHPVVVHAYAGGLVATTLHYPGEVTPPSAYMAIRNLPAPKDAERTLAKRIIDELSGEFSISEFHDRYREAIMELVEKKLAGQKPVYAEPRPEEAKELMEALRATISELQKR